MAVIEAGTGFFLPLRSITSGSKAQEGMFNSPLPYISQTDLYVLQGTDSDSSVADGTSTTSNGNPAPVLSKSHSRTSQVLVNEAVDFVDSPSSASRSSTHGVEGAARCEENDATLDNSELRAAEHCCASERLPAVSDGTSTIR
jgi:hypothetical protein